MEFTLLFAAAFGVGAGAAALRWEAARGNAAECAADLWQVFLTAIIVGLGVGRLAAMMGAGINPLTNLADILVVRGGVATGPAAVAALASIALSARGEVIAVFDALAVAGLAGLGGWHLGCLARQACLGTTTELPWAMYQPGSSIGRHPVELYAAGLYLLAAVALAQYRRRPLQPGRAAAVALVTAGVVRLVTEPFRVSLSGGPVWWYVAAAAVGIGGLFVVGRRARSDR